MTSITFLIYFPVELNCISKQNNMGKMIFYRFQKLPWQWKYCIIPRSYEKWLMLWVKDDQDKTNFLIIVTGKEHIQESMADQLMLSIVFFHGQHIFLLTFT